MGLLDTFTKFPELKKNFNFVGECHERNALIQKTLVDEIVKMYLKLGQNKSQAERISNQKVSEVMVRFDISTTTIAQSLLSEVHFFKKFTGVTINRDYGYRVEYFLSIGRLSVESKFHPVGCDTIRSHLDHEIGHQLDNLLGLSDMAQVQELFEERVIIENGSEDFTKITAGLSKYAWKNDNLERYGEFIAEVWSEYCNNPNPREIAMAIGKLIEREYAKKFSR